MGGGGGGFYDSDMSGYIIMSPYQKHSFTRGDFSAGFMSVDGSLRVKTVQPYCDPLTLLPTAMEFTTKRKRDGEIWWRMIEIGLSLLTANWANEQLSLLIAN